MVTTHQAGATTVVIGGHTVRLASITLVKTSQVMQVDTVLQEVAGQGQRIVQAGPGKQTPLSSWTKPSGNQVRDNMDKYPGVIFTTNFCFYFLNLNGLQKEHVYELHNPS